MEPSAFTRRGQDVKTDQAVGTATRLLSVSAPVFQPIEELVGAVASLRSRSCWVCLSALRTSRPCRL